MVEMITKTRGEMESKECRDGDKFKSEKGTAGGKGTGEEENKGWDREKSKLRRKMKLGDGGEEERGI